MDCVRGGTRLRRVVAITMKSDTAATTMHIHMA